MVNKKTVKKKITLKKRINRIKKKIIAFGKLFVEEVKNLWIKFTSLPKVARTLVYLWSVVLLVVIVLVLAGHNNNKFLEKYKILEKSMVRATLDYVGDNSIFAGKDNKLKLDLHVLKEENYLTDSMDISERCKGDCLYDYDSLDKKGICDDFCLLDFNEKKEKYFIEDSCEGFTVAYYDDINEKYNVTAYVKCGNYTTEGYYDYK